MLYSWALGTLFSSVFLFSSARAEGNTTCKTSSLDWYTSVVGETPCTTYQRLRQICNSAYTVGSLNTNTPPDNCDEQLADCCCNSIAFSLSMLCLNCQQGTGSGVGSDTGYDAGNGAYQMYLTKGDGSQCSPNKNQSLPSNIQTAVCNSRIKIEDDLYGLFWSNGAWFYEFTRERISTDHAVDNNNTFTHCASTTVNTTSSSSVFTASSTSSNFNPSSSTSQNSDSTKSSSISGGAIGGIAIGVSAVLMGAIIAFWLLRRRRSGIRSSMPPDLFEGNSAEMSEQQIAASHVDPYHDHEEGASSSSGGANPINQYTTTAGSKARMLQSALAVSRSPESSAGMSYVVPSSSGSDIGNQERSPLLSQPQNFSSLHPASHPDYADPPPSYQPTEGSSVPLKDGARSEL